MPCSDIIVRADPTLRAGRRIVRIFKKRTALPNQRSRTPDRCRDRARWQPALSERRQLGWRRRQTPLRGFRECRWFRPPAERRLRQGNYRVERGAVELKAEGVPGYGVSVSETIEKVEPAAPAEGATP